MTALGIVLAVLAATGALLGAARIGSEVSYRVGRARGREEGLREGAERAGQLLSEKFAEQLVAPCPCCQMAPFRLNDEGQIVCRLCLVRRIGAAWMIDDGKLGQYRVTFEPIAVEADEDEEVES